MRRLPTLLCILTPTLALAEPIKPDIHFATAMYGVLSKKPGNLFFSPASIQLAFSMAAGGARGETAAQMQSVLGSDGTIHEKNAAQLRRWDTLANPAVDPNRAAQSPEMQRYDESELARKRILLNVVNRLWAQKGKALRADYTTLLKDKYRAPVAQVDFEHAPEPSRVEINKWVSTETKKKIPELLAKKTISEATRLVLVNAIYFKATWAQQFTKSSTTEQPFHAPGHDVRAPLMTNIDHFQLARIDGGQLLELPYGAGDLAMDVILPTAKDGLPAVEKALAEGALHGWLAGLKSARVEVSLPRWKTSSAMELADTLKAMGAKLPFESRGADFSGIDDTHELFLSAVIHQAVVDVNEDGTEAAAATAVIMMQTEAALPLERPIVFRADHPFVYLIRDTSTGAVLFAGRLSDPKAN